MKVWIALRNLRIISLNNSHGADYKKTVETQGKIAEIKRQLREPHNRTKLMAIKRDFNKKENYLAIEYNWLVPKGELFNKQGTLAERLGDWSNFPKIYDDVIFNDVLGIDDSQAKSGQVNIMQSRDDYHYVMISIYVANIKKLNSWILEEDAEEELGKAMSLVARAKAGPRKPAFDPVADYLTKAH